MDQEFYRENPAVRTVQWYDCKYVFPVGIELRQDIPENFNENTVFAVQNRIFSEIIGRNENLIQEVPVHLDEANGMDIIVHGRKKLYFYGDFTYEAGNPAIDEITINGEVFRIPDRVDVQGTSYPSENNNRILDLGTFDDETVHLEWKGLKEEDISKLHLGLFDIARMKGAVNEICERNTTSKLETGSDYVFLQHRSERESLLFLPMNYFESWKCEVNGIPTELKSVFGGFVGVPIYQGENEIRMNYVHSYSQSAWYLTCFSLLMGIILVRCRNQGIAMNRCKYLDDPVIVLYGGLGILLFLAVYAIPLLMIGKKAIG